MELNNPPSNYLLKQLMLRLGIDKTMMWLCMYLSLYVHDQTRRSSLILSNCFPIHLHALTEEAVVGINVM